MCTTHLYSDIRYFCKFHQCIVTRPCTLPGYKANQSMWPCTRMDLVYETFELFPVWFLFDFYHMLPDGGL